MGKIILERNLQPKCLRRNGQNDSRAQSTTKVFEAEWAKWFSGAIRNSVIQASELNSAQPHYTALTTQQHNSPHSLTSLTSHVLTSLTSHAHSPHSPHMSTQSNDTTTQLHNYTHTPLYADTLIHNYATAQTQVYADVMEIQIDNVA